MESQKCFEPAVTVSEFCPYVSLLLRKKRGYRCDECFAENKLIACRECSVFQYCSPHCENKNEKFHRYECAILKRHPSKINEINDDALFLLRLYYFSKSEEGKIVDSFFGKSRQFEDLMSHEENITKDIKRCQDFMKLADQIGNFVRDVLPTPGQMELLITFGKMVINSFSILDDDLNGHGTGLYLGASSLNHSCDPNCTVIFSGTKLLLRSNRDIEKNDELTITYIDQMNCTGRRRQELMDSYYFHCSCEHCMNQERDDEMISLLPGQKIFREAINNDYLAVESQAQKLKNSGDAQGMYEISKILFSKWSHKLRPWSVYVYKSLDMYFDACIDLQEWDKTVGNGQRMIRTQRRYIGYPHPKGALDVLKLSKILLHLRNYEQAIYFFEKAEEEINFVFGGNSSMASTARDLRLQCLMEARL